MSEKLETLVIAPKNISTEELKKIEVFLWDTVKVSHIIQFNNKEELLKIIRRIITQELSLDLIILVTPPFEELKVLNKIKTPIIYWTWDMNGNFIMWNWEFLNFLKMNRVNVVFSHSLPKVNRKLRAFRAKKSLLKKNIVILSSRERLPFVWNYKEVLTAAKSFGANVMIKRRDLLELLLRKISNEHVMKVLKEFPISWRDLNDEDVIEAFRIYIALKKLAKIYNCIGIGIDCLSSPVKGLNGKVIQPCLAFSLLNDEGIYCGCEGDFLSIITMALVGNYLNEPCFMTNIYPLSIWSFVSKHLGITSLSLDLDKHMLLCHCARLGCVPPSMACKFELVKKFDKIDKHGVMVNASLERGPITIIKISPMFDSIQVIQGYLKDMIKTDTLHCRVAALVEVKNSDLIADNLYSHHVVVIKGNYVSDLEDLAKVLKLNIEIM